MECFSKVELMNKTTLHKFPVSVLRPGPTQGIRNNTHADSHVVVFSGQILIRGVGGQVYQRQICSQTGSPDAAGVEE